MYDNTSDDLRRTLEMNAYAFKRLGFWIRKAQRTSTPWWFTPTIRRCAAKRSGP